MHVVFIDLVLMIYTSQVFGTTGDSLDVALFLQDLFAADYHASELCHSTLPMFSSPQWPMDHARKQWSFGYEFYLTCVCCFNNMCVYVFPGSWGGFNCGVSCVGWFLIVGLFRLFGVMTAFQ